MSESAGKPQIRFKGFTDAWEQRKFGEIFDFERPDNYTVVDTHFVKQGTPVLTANKSFILGYTQESGVYDKGNCIIFDDFTLDSKYVDFPFKISSSGIKILTSTPSYNLKFAYYLLNSSNILMQGHARHYISIVQPYFTNVPILNEQNKIEKFVTSIDNLITLHQRKYEKLVNVKKSLLEKMFPSDGENTPKIRFKGFSDAWEQRKVTEVGKVAIGLVTTMTSHYTNEGCLLIRNSDIRDNHFEFDTNPIFLDIDFANRNSGRRHQIGDVITVHTGDVGTSAVIGEKEANSIGFATIITRPNKEIIDSNYLSCFLNTDKHKNWAVAISTGDGRTNYNLGDYVNLVVPVTSISEQQKISELFLNLNNLITLHQSKLEKLKNIKKSLLEKMFA